MARFFLIKKSRETDEIDSAIEEAKRERKRGSVPRPRHRECERTFISIRARGSGYTYKGIVTSSDIRHPGDLNPLDGDPVLSAVSGIYAGDERRRPSIAGIRPCVSRRIGTRHAVAFLFRPSRSPSRRGGLTMGKSGILSQRDPTG